MKALVTGSTGFVGAQVVRALLAAGHSVRALHRASSNTLLIDGLDVEAALGDVTDAESLRAASAASSGISDSSAIVTEGRGSKCTPTNRDDCPRDQSDSEQASASH